MRKLVLLCLVLSFGVCKMDIKSMNLDVPKYKAPLVCKIQVDEYTLVCIHKMPFIERIIATKEYSIGGAGTGAGVGLASIPHKTCECVAPYEGTIVFKDIK